MKKQSYIEGLTVVTGLGCGARPLARAIKKDTGALDYYYSSGPWGGQRPRR